MICRNCGAENRESASFCRKCGTKLTSEEEVIKVGEDTASDITEKDTGDEVITIGARSDNDFQKAYGAGSGSGNRGGHGQHSGGMPGGNMNGMNSIYGSIPANLRPLSAWAYFGYSLLFALPVAGLIMMIIFALDDSNINRRNYARSNVLLDDSSCCTDSCSVCNRLFLDAGDNVTADVSVSEMSAYAVC